MTAIPDRLLRLRRLVVEAAHAELLPRFATVTRAAKADGSLVTEADTAMQARLTRELAAEFPQYALLGEEMGAAEQSQLLQSRDAGLWCLDPLDGTTNFATGLPYYAVSLGLIVGGERALGIVYDPARDECFMAARGEGAWLNDQRLRMAPPRLALRRAVAVVDLKRLPPRLAQRLAIDPPFASQRNLGACALDWCWLAAGRFQVYVHGGQRLWDHAAGGLILAEAGGHAVTLDGEPLFLPTLSARSAVAALEPDLFEAWRAWIDLHRADDPPTTP